MPTIQVLVAGGKLPVHGKGTSSLDEERKTYPDDEDVVFKSFSLLLPEPVHEKAVLHMAQEHANRDARADPNGPEPGEESEDEQHRAQGLDNHENEDRPMQGNPSPQRLEGSW